MHNVYQFMKKFISILSKNSKRFEEIDEVRRESILMDFDGLGLSWMVLVPGSSLALGLRPAAAALGSFELLRRVIAVPR